MATTRADACEARQSFTITRRLLLVHSCLRWSVNGQGGDNQRGGRNERDDRRRWHHGQFRTQNFPRRPNTTVRADLTTPQPACEGLTLRVQVKRQRETATAATR